MIVLHMDILLVPLVVIVGLIVLALLKDIFIVLLYAIKEYVLSHRPALSKKQEEQLRKDLLEGILILSADIIKAGGKQRQYQVQFVKDYLEMQFGKDVVPTAMNQLDAFLNQNKIDFYQALPKLRGVVVDTLIRYLISLAIADGEFSMDERELIERIGIGMNLGFNEIKSIIASIYSELSGGEKKDDSEKSNQDKKYIPTEYAILEIEPSATDKEVLTAYRRKAMECHPDRVATSGPEAQKIAAEKFKQVHDAFQSIKRERGMD